METQELIFWMAVALIVVTMLLWFGREILINMIATTVEVTP